MCKSHLIQIISATYNGYSRFELSTGMPFSSKSTFRLEWSWRQYCNFNTSKRIHLQNKRTSSNLYYKCHALPTFCVKRICRSGVSRNFDCTWYQRTVASPEFNATWRKLGRQPKDSYALGQLIEHETRCQSASVYDLGGISSTHCRKYFVSYLSYSSELKECSSKLGFSLDIGRNGLKESRSRPNQLNCPDRSTSTRWKPQARW